MKIESTYAQTAINQVADYLRNIRTEVVDASGDQLEFTEKDDASVVTEYDRKIESDIRNILTDIDDGIGIYGEEFGQEGDTSNFWTIDPIDGTEMYIRGNPFYTCMLGLVLDNEPSAALIYNYAFDELYTRLPSQDTRLNEKVTRVSQRGMSRAIVELEIRHDNPKRGGWMSLIEGSAYTGQQVAASGFGMTQVIKGAIEARVQLCGYGQLYDYLPGQILVEGAGGVVSTPHADTWDWRNSNYVASNAIVADDLKSLAEKCLELD